MKLIALFITILLIYSYFSGPSRRTRLPSKESIQSGITAPAITYAPLTPQKTAVIAERLDTPWALAFLPGGDILVTERPGRVRIIEGGRLLQEPVFTEVNAREIGEGGLLGIAPDPDFSANSFVYLYYTYRGSGNNTLNRVVRTKLSSRKLQDEKTIIDAIPGASNHNGGRLKFGPDKFLYITTGDAQDPSRAQDKNSTAGKILRATSDGNPAPDNPFGNLVYSYGHRNSQGLAWDDAGNLYATEHGRSFPVSGLDEVNIIRPGRNFGWDIIQGSEKKEGMETPLADSGSDTWAPSGAAFHKGFLYFTGLRGSALYRWSPGTGKTESFFKDEFGRLRDVVVGPDDMLYVATSNRDGRGNPAATDDKILKIDPAGL